MAIAQQVRLADDTVRQSLRHAIDVQLEAERQPQKRRRIARAKLERKDELLMEKTIPLVYIALVSTGCLHPLTHRFRHRREFVEPLTPSKEPRVTCSELYLSARDGYRTSHKQQQETSRRHRRHPARFRLAKVRLMATTYGGLELYNDRDGTKRE